MLTPGAQDLLTEPLRAVKTLERLEIPAAPGVYAWYRHSNLLYVGESHRGLRSRIWVNHLRGNARSSTLRNKVAKALGFPAIGRRAYGPEAERVITSKLQECDLRFLAVPLEVIAQVQSDLIGSLDPPMNDHAGQIPRWRLEEVREILDIACLPDDAPTPALEAKSPMPIGLAESQRITLTDIRAGRIRFPREAKSYFPNERSEVQVLLRGARVEARYDPRTGPDKERSGVLLVGKANLEKLVRADDVLSILFADGTVRLD